YQVGIQLELIAKEFHNLSKIGNNPFNDYQCHLVNKYQNLNYDSEKFKTESEKYFSEAIEQYKAAFKYRKCRAEPLFNLASLYRYLGRYKEALSVAQLGK